MCKGVRYANLFLLTTLPRDNSKNEDIGIIRSDGYGTVLERANGQNGMDQISVIGMLF